MHRSFQGTPALSRSRFATLGVAAMMVLAGLLTMTVAAPGAAAAPATPPAVTAAVFKDSDFDGYLDTVDVTFTLDADNKPLVAATVRPFDFTIKSGTREVQAYGCAVTTATPIACDGVGSGSTRVFTLHFPELERLDGGTAPDLLYAGGARDTDDTGEGAKGVLASDITEMTDADPYFLRAFGTTDTTVDQRKVVYWFTERVRVNPSGSQLFSPSEPHEAVCLIDADRTTETKVFYESGGFSETAPTGTFVLNQRPSSADLATVREREEAPVQEGGGPTGGCTNNVGIQDLAGNTIANGDTAEFRLDRALVLKAALTSIDSKEVTLAFDGPVAAPDGSAIDLQDAQKAFLYDNPNVGGATTIAGVRHVPGASRVTLVLNEPLESGEVGATGDGITVDPTYLLIGAGSEVFGANSVKLQQGSFKFTGAPSVAAGSVDDRWDKVDLAPRATEAATADLDGDGRLDAVRVVFDQPVELTGGTPVFSVQDVVGGTVTTATVTDVFGPDGGDCKVDAATTTRAVAAAPDTVWVCIDDWTASETVPALGTGVTPEVSFNGVGVEDDFGNKAAGFAGLRSVDEAAPVVESVWTVDESPTGTPNGHLDGLRFRVSEPVDGASYVPAAFDVTHTVGTTEHQYPVGSGITTNAEQRTFTLSIAERTGDGDTGLRPEVVYAPANDGQALKDLEGNIMAPFTSTQQQTLDQAVPQLVEALGTVGSNTISLRFSEPVGTNTDGTGALIAGDFDYQAKDLTKGPTGINGIQPSSDPSRWTLVMDEGLDASDVGANGDTLRVRVNSIHDVAGLAVPSGGHALGTATALQLHAVRTRDYFDFGSSGDSSAAGTTPVRRANGLIDTIEIVFTTPVDDGYDANAKVCRNLVPSEWRVEVNSEVLEPTFMETYVPPPNEVVGWKAGECQDPRTGSVETTRGIVYLIFDETEGWGTGVKPLVDHLGDTNNDGNVLTGESSGDYPVTSDIPTTDHANPVLVKASASVGSDQLTLTFSEAVKGTGADGRFRASDLQYRNLNAAGATGFSSVSSGSGGVTTVTLTTTPALEAGDIDQPGDPVTGDGVRPYFDPGQHPSGSRIVDMAGNKVVYQDFSSGTATEMVTRIRDESAPFVTARLTQDHGADGFLDSVKLTFNEQVRASDNGCISPQLWTLTVDGEEVDVTRVTASPGTACTGGFSPASDLHVEFDGLEAEAGTGAEVRVSYTPPDLEQQPNAAFLVDNEGNALQALASQKASDGAAPVLVRLDGCPAGPVDKPGHRCDTENQPASAQAETVDRNGDGIVERMRVRFSEPVKQDSVRPQDWHVHGAAEAEADKKKTVSREFDGLFVEFLIQLPQDPTPDTSVTPTLTYDPVDENTDDNVVPAVVDLAPTPNQLSATSYKGSASKLVTRDGAPPVILPRANALVDDKLTLAFSEPVYNRDIGTTPPTEPLHNVGLDNIDYLNENAGGGSDAAKARTHVHHDAEGGEFKDDEVVVVFNAVPTADDREKDRLRLTSIYDAAGLLASATRASLTGEVEDMEPPAKINDLRATGRAVDADSNEITVSWTSPPRNSKGVDDLNHFVITIDDLGDSAPARDISTVTASDAISDPVTMPTPVAGTAQQLKVTGVESGKTYRFTIRTVDDSGLQSPLSESADARVPFFDATAPGAITDLQAGSPTGNSATLAWTAPGDKDGEGQDVKVAGYEVRVATEPFTDFTKGNLVSASNLAYTPANLAAAGQTQKLVVSGLLAETRYHFAVRAVDAQPNPGVFDTATATTTKADTTPPTGTLTVVSSTHPSGTAVANDSPTFTWSGLTDPDSEITYYYALSTSSTHAVTGTEAQTDLTGSTTQTTKGFTDVPAGTWYFHVRGYSQGGAGDDASYHIIVRDAGTIVVDPDDLEAANEALQDLVKVTRQGDDNVVEWTLPDTDLPVAGIQVWRSTSPYELLVDLPAGSGAFADGRYVDEDAPEDALYIVTLYFDTDPTAGQVEDVAVAAGYDGLTEEELSERGTKAVVGDPPNDTPVSGDGLPAWLWALLVVGLLGIVAAVVVPVTLTRRKRDAGWDEPAQWDDTWSEDAYVAGDAPDLDADGETEHYIECPKCDHGFEVHGEKPLETTCPNCGVRGVLR